VAQKEALIVQKRVAGSECSELRVAIGERKGRIQQLQARYDSSIANLGVTSDGLPMTTAYIKIQSAQERYLLYERGNKLDETIRRTEQEICSMENTLRVVNVCNDKYKDSMSIVEEDGPERMEQKTLDKQMYNARQTLCQRQEQLQKLFDELQKTQDEHSVVLDDIEKAKEEKEDKQRYLSSLEKQIAEQTEKISRADKNLRKVQKDIQNLYICKGDDTLILQQVRRYKFVIKADGFILETLCRKRWNCENSKSKMRWLFKTSRNSRFVTWRLKHMLRNCSSLRTSSYHASLYRTNRP
jgi:chromosome segregation ATPase